ncbi:MAG: hypothetical protein ABSA40_05110 [Candidatus Dormibacteria bacterium]|jgi:hypothetical protein
MSGGAGAAASAPAQGVADVRRPAPWYHRARLMDTPPEEPQRSRDSRFVARLSAADVSGRKTYDLVDEPVGDDYRALLLCARPQCDTAVLSVDTTRELAGPGRELLGRLAPSLRSEAISAGVRRLRYELSGACIEVLGTAPGLFAWMQPDRPENLCLLRPDGSPWIVSIAGDRIGYVELSPFEKLLLGRAAPGVAAVLAHQGATDAILAALERRLESGAEAVQAGMLDYARTVLDEGREGLVVALRDWLGSGEQVRVTAALHVAGRLRLTELGPDLSRLLDALRRGEVAVPAVYRSNMVLGARWRAHLTGQLTEALDALRSRPAPSV